MTYKQALKKSATSSYSQSNLHHKGILPDKWKPDLTLLRCSFTKTISLLPIISKAMDIGYKFKNNFLSLYPIGNTDSP